MQATPKKHHLDRRADAIACANAGIADDLLSTAELAQWLGCSAQWLEIGRGKNYGPKFVRVTGRTIRYRRADVLEWLETRTHKSTAEYVGATDTRKSSARKQRAEA